MAGDDCQALVFWSEACRLFTEPDLVERVGNSLRGKFNGFDDVVVFYKAARDGTRRGVDCHQVKFHMRSIHRIGHEELMDPAAFGRKKHSLLEILMRVGDDAEKDGVPCNCILHVAATIPVDLPLGKIWGRLDGKLDISELERSGPQSDLGRIREEWMGHLQTTEVERLKSVLNLLQISVIDSLESLRSALDDRLRLAGLAPVGGSGKPSPYVGIIRGEVQKGRHEFTRDILHHILKDQGLVVRAPFSVAPTRTVGVQSFSRGAEHFGAEMDTHLSLLDCFERRHLRDGATWEDVAIKVDAFVSTLPRDRTRVDIFLAAHLSIAFMLGYLMDSKSGLHARVCQPTLEGVTEWEATFAHSGASRPQFNVDDRQLGSGNDVAIALSVTHDVHDGVLEYIKSCPSIGRLTTFGLPNGPSRDAVIDGEHAASLAEQAVSWLRVQRTSEQRAGTIHVFAAAPAGLVFRMGKQARGLGSVQLYEHDFESGHPASYSPSILLPGSSG
jgi:hypothetical protein